MLIKAKLLQLEQYDCFNIFKTRKKEFILSKQFLRSGTSIGANIKESVYGQSTKDFVSKLRIALKEASETKYWIELLFETGYITEKEFISIHTDCVELIKILISIINSSNKNNNKSPNSEL